MNASKLIVIGDPHIAASADLSRGVSTAANLSRAIAHINTHHADAALCLLIGDLTHNGESAEYAHFQSLVAPLTVPSALMIGNHDNRAAFLDAFPDAPKDANGFVQFTVDLGETHRLIALDSLNAPPYSFMRHIGQLCEQRLAFLEAALNSAENRKLIIAMHHQPFRIGLPGMDAIRLWDEARYLNLIRQYQNVEMQLMGHNHRTISGVSHGIPFACFKSMSVQTPLDLETPDPTAGIAEPPSYGVLLLSADGVLVHQEEFTVKAPRQSDWANVSPEIAEGWKLLIKTMLPDLYQ